MIPPTKHVTQKMNPKTSIAQTIKVMGEAARDASRKFALVEWARGEAALAPRRNYREQLRRIFDAIARRWRYVMESEEWVHGDGESLIRIVLGSKYNGDPDLDRVSLSAVPTTRPGWGDCDDVSQAVAAAVLAIGMTPFFRVVMGPRGGHVSVLARTPRGELVSMDPVGLPDHGFGWMMPAAPENVTLWSVDGKQIKSGLGCPDTGAGTAMVRAERTFRPVNPTPSKYDASRGSIMSNNVIDIRRGGYLACAPCMLADDPDLGSIKDIKRRWKKRAQAIKKSAAGKIIKKVRRLHNKIVAKILSNKVAQKIVGSVLMAYGVPPLVAPAVMRMGAEIIANDGLLGFVNRLKKDPKLAARMVRDAIKKGLIPKNLIKGKLAEVAQNLSGADDYAFTRMIPLGSFGATNWAVAATVPDQAAESANVKIALAESPATSRGQSQKSGQSESDWLTNVVLWETYPKSPLTLSSKRSADKPYITAWLRIEKNIKNGLAVSKTSTPSKKSFAINTQENAIADEVARSRPTSQSHRGVMQVRKSSQSPNDWLANVAYWRAYPDGPTTIGKKDKNYIDAWRRLAARVNKATKTTTPTTKTTTPTTKTTTPTTKTTTPTTKTTTPTTKTTTPTTKTTTPTTQTTQTKMSDNCWEDDLRKMSICEDLRINPQERAIAMLVARQKPTSERVRSGTQRRKSGQNLNDWLANVAYWRAYPEGPVTIPGSATQYIAAWKRIKSEVVRALMDQKLPDVDPGPNKLPDVDPGPNKLPDVDPGPGKTSNVWPIVAGAAALLLALKGS